MSRESIVFLIGFVVFITPFLGIPTEWKHIVFIVGGALLMFLGYGLRRSAFFRAIDTGNGERKGDAFVESPQKQESVEESNIT